MKAKFTLTIYEDDNGNLIAENSAISLYSNQVKAITEDIMPKVLAELIFRCVKKDNWDESLKIIAINTARKIMALSSKKEKVL